MGPSRITLDAIAPRGARNPVRSGRARPLAIVLAVAALALLALAPIASAHALPHLETYRVLTYNVAGIDAPAVDDEYAPEVSASDRADQISDYVNKGGYDIVAINEVFENPPPQPLMRDDFLDDLSPNYPHHVDILEGDSPFDVLDSGLMLFSKFPFVGVTPPADGEDVCVEKDDDGNCLIAFHEYESSGAEDMHAAKGIGFVRVENPRTEAETNVFFTHLQASGTALPVSAAVTSCRTGARSRSARTRSRRRSSSSSSGRRRTTPRATRC